jgi:hypothetical protein
MKFFTPLLLTLTGVNLLVLLIIQEVWSVSLKPVLSTTLPALSFASTAFALNRKKSNESIAALRYLKLVPIRLFLFAVILGIVIWNETEFLWLISFGFSYLVFLAAEIYYLLQMQESSVYEIA